MSKHVKSKDLDIPKSFPVGIKYFIPVLNNVSLDTISITLNKAIDAIEKYYDGKFEEFNTTINISNTVTIKLAIREKTIEFLHGKLIDTVFQNVVDNKSFKLIYKDRGVSYKSVRAAIERFISIIKSEHNHINNSVTNADNLSHLARKIH